MAFLPFNFNPVSTTTFAAESFSYTVPAGFFALVEYSLSASSNWYVSVAGANPLIYTLAPAHLSQTGKIELKAGDVLTRTLSAPSGTSVAVGAVSSASVQLNLNGSPIAYIEANATFSQAASTTSATFAKISAASAHAHISEFAIP